MTFLFTVEVYDDFQGNTYTECGVLQAENFAGAIGQVEDYYGDNLESVFCEAYDMSFVHLPIEMYDTLKQFVLEARV